MQFTLIAVQVNGQQLVMGSNVQETAMQNLVRAAVSSNMQFDRPESKYRSFLALGSSANSTQVLRMNDRGEVMSRTAGVV